MTETRDSVRLGSVAAATRGPRSSRRGAQNTAPASAPARPPRDLVACASPLPADLPAILATVRAAFGYDLEARLVVRLERERRVAARWSPPSASVVGHALLSASD